MNLLPGQSFRDVTVICIGLYAYVKSEHRKDNVRVRDPDRPCVVYRRGGVEYIIDKGDFTQMLDKMVRSPTKEPVDLSKIHARRGDR